MEIMKFKVKPKTLLAAFLGMVTEVSFVVLLTLFLYAVTFLVFKLTK